VKILNLYAGIGGNRKLWGDEHEITAVENVQAIADVYHELYPNDTVVVGDAHQYLLDHFKEFDFIWSSPPCPTHSRLSTSLAGFGVYRYPDMTLYQEIIFLQQFFKENWVVENVIPYYEPLIRPTAILDRHLFWSSKHIGQFKTERIYDGSVTDQSITTLSASHGITLPKDTINKRKLLRNAVDPRLGLHVLEAVGFGKTNEVYANASLFSELAINPTKPGVIGGNEE
jgi:DNA (cytosine-5)-methyltransferase 1